MGNAAGIGNDGAGDGEALGDRGWPNAALLNLSKPYALIAAVSRQ